MRRGRGGPSNKANKASTTKTKTKDPKPKTTTTEAKNSTSKGSTQPKIQSFVAKNTTTVPNESEKLKANNQMSLPVPATLATPTLSTTPVPQTPPRNNNKQRTPPSLDREPNSKKILLEIPEVETSNNPSALNVETNMATENAKPNIEDVELTDSEQRIVAAISAKLKPMERSLDSLNDKMEHHHIELQTLHRENNILKTKLHNSEKNNRQLHERLKRLETRVLDKNVLIKGIPEIPWEPENTTWDKVLHELSELMEGTKYSVRRSHAENLSISHVERIGRYKSLENRRILVCFNRKGDTDYVMKFKKHLRPGIFMDREYSVEIDRERKLLRPILKEAHKHQEFKGKCKLEGGDLVILGKKYNMNNLHTLPSPLSGFHATSRSENNILGFFGELNPLSNFHSAAFYVKDQCFHSSEQYIQLMKAKYFEDDPIVTSIMASTSALECKLLAKNIRGYDRDSWIGNAKDLCYPGIHAKFEQNPMLRNLLLNTGDQTLIESSRDKEWGTGIPLHDDRCLLPDKWTSQGLLGKILEEVRASLQPSPAPTARVDRPHTEEINTEDSSAAAAMDEEHA